MSFASYDHIDQKINDGVFKIIDTDFIHYADGFCIEEAVICVYRKRNLNIASNLVLLYRYLISTRGYSLETLLRYNRNNNIFPEKELEKYLILI